MTLKNDIFQSPKIAFFQGITHAFGEKMPVIGLFRFGQNKTRNNAWRLCREKRNLFDYKKQNYANSKKSHFSKGLTHAFSLYLQLIKKRQEIKLGDFAEKKETFFHFKKQSFP